MNFGSIEEQIVGFIRSEFKSSGLEGLVVGVSGGVDSATVSELCIRTGIDTRLVTMPIGPESESDNRAYRFIGEYLQNGSIDLSHNIVCLDSSYNSLLKDIGYEDASGLTKANLQSRLRMCTLYSYANEENRLVVGTDNGIEGLLGFFTKGGDGRVDINPIGNLIKSEVWGLAEHLGIPRYIIEAKPSDGLWEDDRSDEEQIGYSYQDIESTLLYALDSGDFDFLDKEEYPLSKAPSKRPNNYEDILSVIKERYRQTSHKRKLPPSPKINRG